MSHLADLIISFNESKKTELEYRTLLVLDMIEYSTMYPPISTIKEAELNLVQKCIDELVDDIEATNDHILACRIYKTWKKREHILKLAEHANKLTADFMDHILYHQEIRWIKETKSDIQRLSV
ncbi:MAG: hypothetical protein GF411_04040 [Candidatus Lokiarchaeota archaeon]|nr:hypothetical protein [Candidatus Lokiarchaeota archaeon]